MSTQAASTNVADNGFFGNIKSVFGDVAGTVGETFREVFPVWAARELEVQSNTERFQAPLFQPAAAPPRVDEASLTTTQSTTQQAAPQPAGLFDFNFGGTHVSGASIALAAVAIFAVWYLLRD